MDVIFSNCCWWSY